MKSILHKLAWLSNVVCIVLQWMNMSTSLVKKNNWNEPWMRIFVSSIHNLHCQTCKEEEGKIEKKSMQTCPAAVLAKSLKWHHFLHGKGDKYLKGLRNFFYAPFLLGLNRRMACKSPSVCSRDIFQSIWYISNCTDPPTWYGGGCCCWTKKKEEPFYQRCSSKAILTSQNISPFLPF